jgi:hypothetical protein
MNPKYNPPELTAADRRKHLRSIRQGTTRPKVNSFKTRRSPWVVKFERKYGTKISDYKWIHENLLTRKGINKVLKKGRAAYYTSGSRPNQTPTSWARARLASVLMRGPAFKVDKDIVRLHGKRKSRQPKPQK